MMKTFVDLGWGVDGVQMLLPELFEKAGADSVKSATLNSSQPFNAESHNHPNGQEEKS